MFLIVAISKGMENTGEQLRRMGFDIVGYGEKSHRIDALVYNNVGMTQNDSIHSPISDGIFLVNANGKTPDEIASILHHRLYTPLF